MPGIFTLYTTFVDGMIESYEKKGKVEKISRAKVERQLLNQIDKAKFPIEYKLSWYRAVIGSSNFEAFWTSVSTRHRLPNSCSARFDPDPDHSLREYEAPTDNEVTQVLGNGEDEANNEAEGGSNKNANDATAPKDISRTSVSQTTTLVADHKPRSSTSSGDDSSGSSATDFDPTLDPALRPIKRTITTCEYCNGRGHTARLCLQRLNDASKAQGFAKRTQNTPAQLNAKASTTPNQAATATALAPPPTPTAPTKPQGLKRMYQHVPPAPTRPTTSTDAPATKKQKTGGRMELQAWDGIHRGFGEYYD